MTTPDNNYDPAGNTQMFRAFVDEEPAQVQTSGGSRTGLIVGIIAAVVVVAAVAWFALS
ncbi:hypothetical protein ACIP98_16410 [Streptomyces sp. NPDC088354]|uniref:hypothetical protein n=1 Tax=unclassified Streptomyces TaxID=2593676 RepID=UPI0029A06C7E|nr:hypothetical protein [Streptomyces sp. MI02-7b]MDX3076751.1 hypothetical protein [Streptomyces sp. MI02-7b]